jgi:ubiquitin carboxyl-terminal hydrolase 25/28
LEEGQGYDGKANLTHHFHKYDLKADPRKLTPPYFAEQDEWETLDTIKTKRRAGQIINPDLAFPTPVPFPSAYAPSSILPDFRDMDAEHSDGSGYFDLYVCCQCSTHVVASPVIPGVIPADEWKRFVQEKRSNPPVGKSGEWSVIKGVSTILR